MGDLAARRATAKLRRARWVAVSVRGFAVIMPWNCFARNQRENARLNIRPGYDALDLLDGIVWVSRYRVGGRAHVRLPYGLAAVACPTTLEASNWATGSLVYIRLDR